MQNIQTTTQALHKSKEIYNTKTVEQERLRKEGATQRDVDKVCGPGGARGSEGAVSGGGGEARTSHVRAAHVIATR